MSGTVISIARNSFILLLLMCCLPTGVFSPPAAAHENIWLRNEYGERITPSYNRADAYSPKKTCGACHDYRLITSGDHFAYLTRTGPAGTLEGDCLICHSRSYRMDRRVREISAGRYSLAATSGSGLGEVKDHPAEQKRDNSPGLRPFVSYNWTGGAFMTDGRLKGSVIGKTASGNCLRCHHDAMAGEAGTLFSPDTDVHAKAGFQCSDCHKLVSKASGGRLSHNIARGKFARSSFRKELIGSDMMTCGVCHLQAKDKTDRKDRRLAAKNPGAKHAEKFPGVSFHFLLMDCGACHAAASAKGAYLLDMSTGDRDWYTADALEAALRPKDLALKAAGVWKPWICRAEPAKGGQERYVPCLERVSQWFGTRLPGGGIKPIPLARVKSLLRSADALSKVEIKAVNGKKTTRRTVATDNDIILALKLLEKGGYPNAVFVADRVYQMKKGELVSSEDEKLTASSSHVIHHGIRPAGTGKPYGAAGKPDGCVECHSDASVFFNKMKVRRIGRFLKEDYPVPKEPNARPQMSDWGMTGVPAYE